MITDSAASAADGFVTRLENLLLSFAKASLLAMTVLITYNTISRYVFNAPLTGVYTVVEAFLMFVTFYWAISYVERIDGHIQVDLLSRRFPSTVNRLTTISYLLLTFVVILWIDVLTMQKTIELWNHGSQIQGVVHFPLFLSWIIIPIGFTLLLARLLVKVYEYLISDNSEMTDKTEIEKI